MAKQIFGHNDSTGVTDYLDIIEEGNQMTAVVEYVEDVQPLLDRNHEFSNLGATDAGIKKGLWHYASIPTTVIVELRNKGIDIYNKNHERRMFEEINQNYPFLKVTTKRHQ